jgi:hypothetical protein
VKFSDDMWTTSAPQPATALSRSLWVTSSRGRSIAIALARVREGSADEQELIEALERAHELHAELAALVKRQPATFGL